MSNFKITEIKGQSVKTRWEQEVLQDKMENKTDFVPKFWDEAWKQKSRFHSVLGANNRREFNVEFDQEVALYSKPYHRVLGILIARMMHTAVEFEQTSIKVRKNYAKFDNDFLNRISANPSIKDIAVNRGFPTQADIFMQYLNDDARLIPFITKRGVVKELKLSKFLHALSEYVKPNETLTYGQHFKNKTAIAETMKELEIEVSKRIQAKQGKITMVISAEPIEILTSSVGQFTSCHDITHDISDDDCNDYRLGNFYYINDATTYVIKGYSDIDDAESMTFRTLGFWDGMKTGFARPYGHNLEVMEQITWDILEIVFGYNKNMLFFDDVYLSYGRDYRGYIDKHRVKMMTSKTAYESVELLKSVLVADKGFLCPCCGEAFENVPSFDKRGGYDCDGRNKDFGNTAICTECGDTFNPEDEGYYCDSNGEYYCCSECFEAAIIERIQSGRGNWGFDNIANLIW